MYKEWQDGMKCSYGLENVEKYMYIDVYIYMYRPICVCIYVLKPIYYVLIHTRKYHAQHFESANLCLQFKSMKFFSAPLAKLFYLPSFYPLCFACIQCVYAEYALRRSPLCLVWFLYCYFCSSRCS